MKISCINESAGGLLFLWIFLSSVSLIAGYLCIKKPLNVIRFQQTFYEKINWRLEPIDLKKEIKNTQIMGAILVALSIVACLLIPL